MTGNLKSPASGRTWKVPSRPWSMRMKWHDLLFLNWPVPKGQLTELLPSSIQLDCYQSQAWISIVPFHMSGVALRWMPDLPWFSSFPELNVRTYVIADGMPGVWFFTLDATNPLAVRAARFWYHLNYLHARISVERRDGWLRYRSTRTEARQPTAELQVEYRPVGEAWLAKQGSLEHWLTSRYCLYTVDRRGRVLRGEIDHAPWSLRNAQAVIQSNTMVDAYAIELPNPPVSVMYAQRMDVVAWSVRPVSSTQPTASEPDASPT